MDQTFNLPQIIPVSQMMQIHFLYTQRFPGSGSEILPVKEGGIMFYAKDAASLHLKCVCCDWDGVIVSFTHLLIPHGVRDF